MESTSSFDIGQGYNQSDDKIKSFLSKLSDPVTLEVVNLLDQIIVYVWLLIGVTGVTTNLVNLHTFIKMGLEDSVTISFFALAVSDLFASTIAVIQPLCHFGTLLMREFDLGFYLPSYIPMLYFKLSGSSFTLTTVLITTFLAIQRCLCVLLPFHVKGLFTNFKTCCYIVIVFLFSIISFGLMMSRLKIVNTSTHINFTELSVVNIPGSDPYKFLLGVVVGLCITTSCVVTVILCLVIMFFTLRKSMRFRKLATASASRTKEDNSSSKTDNHKEKRSKETQALRQVFIISTIFVTTNSPYALIGLVCAIEPEFNLNKAYHNLFYVIVIFVYTSEYINSAVNFFVYFNYNTKFRNVCFLTSKKKKTPSQ